MTAGAQQALGGPEAGQVTAAGAAEVGLSLSPSAAFGYLGPCEQRVAVKNHRYPSPYRAEVGPHVDDHPASPKGVGFFGVEQRLVPGQLHGAHRLDEGRGSRACALLEVAAQGLLREALVEHPGAQPLEHLVDRRATGLRKR
jgi:hypothetical protein